MYFNPVIWLKQLFKLSHAFFSAEYLVARAGVNKPLNVGYAKKKVIFLHNHAYLYEYSCI